MVEVGLGDGGLLQRDGPLDGELGVGEVNEGVGPLELQRPVGVHQVGVGGAVLQGLEGVAHAARDVDGPARVQHGRVHLPVGGAALAQVHPGAEDRAAGHRDELVPGLRVDAAGDAPLLVVGDVVLDDTEVGDAQGGHLGALPVLLEPAARVAVDGEVDDLEAPDAGLGDLQVLLECDVCHVEKAPIEEVGHPGRPCGDAGSSPCPAAPHGRPAVRFAGVRSTGPVRGSGPRWPPWPGATRTRSRRTSRWWP